MRSFEQQQKNSNASSLTIHPQLEVGGKDDPQEKEANAMADKVMRMSDGDTVRPKMGDEEEGKVRKMGDEEEGKVMKMGDDEEKKVMKMGDDDEKKVMKMGDDEEKKVHKKSDEEEGKVMKMDAGGGGGMAAPANVASGIQNTKGGGQHLPQNVQQDLGGKMGADFSDVKVHTDDHASEMSESINAKAFTHGKDIYFKQGNYSPESGDGKKLLAHELTHTMQNGGAVRRWHDPEMLLLGSRYDDKDIQLEEGDEIASVTITNTKTKRVVSTRTNLNSGEKKSLALALTGYETGVYEIQVISKKQSQKFQLGHRKEVAGPFITITVKLGLTDITSEEYNKVDQNIKEAQKNEPKATDVAQLSGAYEAFESELNGSLRQIQNSNSGWTELYNSIGSAFSRAYDYYNRGNEAQKTYLEMKAEQSAALFNLIVGGAFAFVVEAGPIKTYITKSIVKKISDASMSHEDLDHLKEAVGGLFDKVTDFGIEKLSESKGKEGDSESGSVSPLEFQNNMLNQSIDIHWQLAESVGAMLDAMTAKKALLSYNQRLLAKSPGKMKTYVSTEWSKFLSLRENYRAHIRVISRVLEKDKKPLDASGISAHSAKAEYFRKIQDEFEKSMWAEWMPGIRTWTTMNHEPFSSYWKYENICEFVEKRFNEIGITQAALGKNEFSHYWWFGWNNYDSEELDVVNGLLDSNPRN